MRAAHAALLLSLLFVLASQPSSAAPLLSRKPPSPQDLARLLRKHSVAGMVRALEAVAQRSVETGVDYLEHSWDMAIAEEMARIEERIET